MHIRENETLSICEIWIEKSKSKDYKESKEYKAAVKEAKAKGLSVCVFIGGDSPILPVIDELLNVPEPIVA